MFKSLLYLDMNQLDQVKEEILEDHVRDVIPEVDATGKDKGADIHHVMMMSKFIHTPYFWPGNKFFE